MKLKTYLLLFLFSISVNSQNTLKLTPICKPLDNLTIPLTPYNSGYLTFNGWGDFLRTQHIQILDFTYASTDSFSINTRFKINKPLYSMYIFGQYRDNGWFLSYHSAMWGYLTFEMVGAVYVNFYNLGSDTSWHSYQLNYKKSSATLTVYMDDNLVFVQNDFYCTNFSNNAAFSVGNAGFFPQYGPGSVNLCSNWFSGSIDYIKISVNDSIACNYSFNEGAGQVAKDSASYYLCDRTYPGEIFFPGIHLMLGNEPSTDTCDPVWAHEENNNFHTSFEPLGSGMSYYSNQIGVEQNVESFSLGLTTWNGFLINGGVFRQAGGVPANFIAKWDGNNWSALGGGLNHEPIFLFTYKNDLIATGSFDSADNARKVNYIAKWNGSDWLPLSSGFNYGGMVLDTFNNDLIAGGCFSTAGGIPASHIARWDGNAWSSLGSGMDGIVWALAVYNNELYAGGSFSTAGGVPCNSIAKWNGQSWSQVGNGIKTGDVIFVLRVFNNELWAGGSFLTMDDKLCRNIAKYSPATGWNAVGQGAYGYQGANGNSNGAVVDMQDYKGNLYIGGQFIMIDGRECNRFARWDTHNWCQIEYGPDLRVEDLEVYKGKLILNGDFYSISGKSFSNIASYTDTSSDYTAGDGSLIRYPELFQNYPNPFNPSTTIKYRVAKSGDVEIRIFDITGKLVSSKKENKTPGEYEIIFDGSRYSSGVYFCMMKTDSYKGTKKMLLIK